MSRDRASLVFYPTCLFQCVGLGVDFAFGEPSTYSVISGTRVSSSRLSPYAFLRNHLTKDSTKCEHQSASLLVSRDLTSHRILCLPVSGQILHELSHAIEHV